MHVLVSLFISIQGHIQGGTRATCSPNFLILETHMQIGTYLCAEEQYSYNILLTFGFVPARPEINSEEKYFVI